MSARPTEPLVLREHDDYLRQHRWALLSTTRAGGSPQVSMVAYDFDGNDFVVSCRRASAKFINAARDPRVVVTVVDDRCYLSVSGTAEVVTEGPRLHELTLLLQASLPPDDAAALQREIDRGLEQVGRAILRIVPERVVGRI
jgi:PPOX class probable F420-dependent enzyme